MVVVVVVEIAAAAVEAAVDVAE